jgi:hypothetical protein
MNPALDGSQLSDSFSSRLFRGTHYVGDYLDTKNGLNAANKEANICS